MEDFKSTQKIQFTKTETEYNMKSIRFLLLTITTLFIVIAGLMIVLGISVYTHYHSFSYFYESAKSGRVLTPSVLCVFLGMMLMIVTSIGFFGSLKQSTFMVNLYALILLAMLVAKLILVIMAFTTNTQDLMYSIIDIPVSQYVDEPEIQAEVDRLQLALNCCGSESYLDYAGMDFTTNHSTVVASFKADGFGDIVTMVLPDTCCQILGNVLCKRIWTMNCKDALILMVDRNASLLGVLGISVMFIQLLAVIFAFLLARCIRKLKSEKALLAWKVKEQMIIARQINEEYVTKEPVDRVDQSVYINPQASSTA